MKNCLKTEDECPASMTANLNLNSEAESLFAFYPTAVDHDPELILRKKQQTIWNFTTQEVTSWMKSTYY